MVKFYDNNLKYKLPTNNDCSDVVLNSNFKEWTDHIVTNLSYRCSTGGSRYEYGQDNKLLEQCIEHSKYYQQYKEGNNTIMITHPFYLHLSHMGEIKNERVRKEVDKYLYDLLELLNLNRERSKAKVVVLETIHHYAAATSLLLENGMINQVIFTLYDRGCPLDDNELMEFTDNSIFFGGGYNKRCLSRSIVEMISKASSEKIWAIKELVLNSPEDHSKTLRTSKVKGLSPDRTIKLEEFAKMIDLES